MNIMAFSDTHGEVDVSQFHLEYVDVCVIAGDVSPCRAWSPIYVPFAQIGILAKDNPDVTFIIVPGNHDFVFDESTRVFKPTVSISEFFPKNVHVLIDNGIEIDGMKFWGSPWVPKINGRWAFESKDELEESDIDRRFAMIPEDTDVLITHTPPAFDSCYIDRSYFGPDDFSSHYGSIALAKHIRRVLPSLLFCGHIHTGDHVCQTLDSNGNYISGIVKDDVKTRMYNVSLLDEDYGQFADPLILSYKKGRNEVWEILGD